MPREARLRCLPSSISNTLRQQRASTTAALQPAGPPPTIITSHIWPAGLFFMRNCIYQINAVQINKPPEREACHNLLTNQYRNAYLVAAAGFAVSVLVVF